jgi:hypothetical protein
VIATLPEIRPADAPPEIAALYDRIRAAAAFPQVNLVYRHLATLPGVLAWTWHVLEPHYASGRIEAEARYAVERLPRASGQPIWDLLAEGAARDLHGVLASYDRANAQNLIALTALAAGVRDGVRRTGRRPAFTTDVNRTAAAIPPLPELSQLPDPARELVLALAALHTDHAAGVVPSLYLHLALWPETLETAHVRLDAAIGSTTWNQDKATLLDAAASAAGRLAADLDADAPRPDAPVRERMLAALDLFVAGTIPEMILVGRLLSGNSWLSA